MFRVFIATDLRQESVFLVTTKTIVKARIPESDLALEVLLMTKTRVETRKSEPWDTSWSIKQGLTKNNTDGLSYSNNDNNNNR